MDVHESNVDSSQLTYFLFVCSLVIAIVRSVGPVCICASSYLQLLSAGTYRLDGALGMKGMLSIAVLRD